MYRHLLAFRRILPQKLRLVALCAEKLYPTTRLTSLMGTSLVLLTLLACTSKNDELAAARNLQAQNDIPSLEAALEKYDALYYQAVTALAGRYDTLILLAIKFAEMSNYNAAIQQLDAAYAIKPNDPDLYYYLGLSYTHLAKNARDTDEKTALTKKADQTFKQGLTYNTNHHLLYYGQGVLYGFVLTNDQAAIAALERAYALEPYDINVLFALGNLYYRTGQLRVSARYYREIIDKAPKNSPKWQKAQKNLARIQASS